MSRRIKGILVLIVLILAGIAWYISLEVSKDKRTAFTVRGIDISHHNGLVEWAKVDSGLAFVIMKATQGNRFKDPRFDSNWKEARKKGLVRGAYHYFHPGIPASEQFQHFKSVVQLEKGDMPPMLDVENKRCDMNEVGKWMDMAEQHYGMKPVLYSTFGFFKVFIADRIPACRVWLYSDENRDFIPAVENYDCILWQHSHRGNLRGFKGPVDLNRFLGDRIAFEALLKN